MTHAFYIAWRYLAHYRVRSAILLASLTLLLGLPVSLRILAGAGTERLAARAAATPLIAGARASALDLALGTLYYTDVHPPPVTWADSEAIAATGLARPIPMLVRFRARGAPVVGTTLDYFGFRGLAVARGRGLAWLGECVLGARVAARLGLAPGTTLVSSPQTAFDLGGAYPLRMHVVGVLAPVGNPDDDAVFIDVKTAWVMAGLGHGHEDLATATTPGEVLARTADVVTAGAQLAEFNEVTARNIGRYHFHGDATTYPLSAVIAVPVDARGGALLQGRYLDPGERLQMLVPGSVVAELLARVFRVRALLDATLLAVGGACVLLLLLVYALTLRLRAPEFALLQRLGASRGTAWRLLAAELALLTGAAALGAGLLAAAVATQAHALARFALG